MLRETPDDVIAETRNACDSRVGYSFDTSFQGPLHDGGDRSKGKVRALLVL